MLHCILVQVFYLLKQDTQEGKSCRKLPLQKNNKHSASRENSMIHETKNGLKWTEIRVHTRTRIQDKTKSSRFLIFGVKRSCHFYQKLTFCEKSIKAILDIFRKKFHRRKCNCYKHSPCRDNLMIHEKQTEIRVHTCICNKIYVKTSQSLYNLSQWFIVGNLDNFVKTD